MQPRLTLAITLACAALNVVAFCALAETAEACDCAPPSMLLPTSVDTQVPSNTKVWILSTGCGAALRIKGGDAVDFTTTTITVGRSIELRVLHPSQLLEIGTTYEVSGCSLIGSPEFTVAIGPDATAPSVPSFSVGPTEKEPDDGCGPTESAALQVSSDGDILVLDIAGRASLDADAYGGTVVDATQAGWPWFVGDQGCGSNWDFDRNGDATSVRIAAFDHAGNFSGWSAAQTVPGAAGDDGCGCVVVGREAHDRAPWLALFVLAGLASARSRRRSSHGKSTCQRCPGTDV